MLTTGWGAKVLVGISDGTTDICEWGWVKEAPLERL